MESSYSEKQEQLGQNDEALGAKKESLSDAQEAKATAEAFLETMRPMCAEKAKEYEQRKLLRASEEAAISEAVAILNKDSAFALFGKVSATSTGAAFFQRVAARSHKPGAQAVRREAVRLLRGAAGTQR